MKGIISTVLFFYILNPIDQNISKWKEIKSHGKNSLSGCCTAMTLGTRTVTMKSSLHR